MTATCPSCGQEHALFLYKTRSAITVCFDCPVYPATVVTVANPVPHVVHRLRRLFFDGPITAQARALLPVVESRGLIKDQAKRQQRQFIFLNENNVPTRREP